MLTWLTRFFRERADRTSTLERADRTSTRERTDRTSTRALQDP